MTRIWVVLIIIASCGGLQGCLIWLNPYTMENLPLPPTRFVMKGYSFLPPAEEGWMWIPGSTKLIIVKCGPRGQDGCFAVSPSLVSKKGVSTSESLVEYLRKEELIDLKDKHYQNARQDFSTTSVGGALCAVYDGEAEDHDWLTRSGQKKPYFLQVRRIVCVHPTLKDKLVSVRFTHQWGYDRDPAFLGRSQSLFDSIEFNGH